jgi:hypothetical protein
MKFAAQIADAPAPFWRHVREVLQSREDPSASVSLDEDAAPSQLVACEADGPHTMNCACSDLREGDSTLAQELVQRRRGTGWIAKEETAEQVA